MWILVLAAVIVIALGFAVDRLGWHDLISGYNTMSREKKDRVNIKKVARLVAWMCYGIGAIFLIIALIEGFELDIPLAPFFLVIIVFTVVMLWRMQRYDGNIYDESGALRPGGKKRLIPIVIVSVVLLVGVPALLFWFSQPTDVTVTNSTIVIEGSYGREIPFDELEDVTWTTLPDIARRTNGADSGSRLTGHFRTETGEDVLLFIDRDVEPVIRLDWSEEPIYLNQSSAEATRELYEDIRSR
ncbi:MULTISPECIES: DUF3784 domain-containing protein [unclassified Exiguobacterium]|uniref:DUF3784 domain-containing protein n=1 Tax=unclassified Exiguobacterium TaxID=2644629 RepID=UPI001BE62FA7|nr:MULTISPECIES: DUF3784 domain-containing protein [unclassified Exiguobacterium]